MMIKMTDAELKELCISIVLWNDWTKIMNAIWRQARRVDPKNVINNGENAIVWNRPKDVKWTITCQFVNNKYLQVEVDRNGTSMLEVRNLGNPEIAASTAVLFISLHIGQT